MIQHIVEWRDNYRIPKTVIHAPTCSCMILGPHTLETKVVSSGESRDGIVEIIWLYHSRTKGKVDGCLLWHCGHWLPCSRASLRWNRSFHSFSPDANSKDFNSLVAQSTPGKESLAAAWKVELEDWQASSTSDPILSPSPDDREIPFRISAWETLWLRHSDTSGLVPLRYPISSDVSAIIASSPQRSRCRDLQRVSEEVRGLSHLQVAESWSKSWKLSLARMR